MNLHDEARSAPLAEGVEGEGVQNKNRAEFFAAAPGNLCQSSDPGVGILKRG